MVICDECLTLCGGRTQFAPTGDVCASPFGYRRVQSGSLIGEEELDESYFVKFPNDTAPKANQSPAIVDANES